MSETTATSTILVVNADDFGLSPGISRAIVRAHAEGIVTSTSLMVRHDAAAEAVALALEHPSLGLGLHVDLGEWRVRDGTWHPVYDVVDLDDEMAVRDEVERQLERFRSLVRAEPTHIDSHQHVHRGGVAQTALREVARRLDVPLRHSRRGARYVGDFYGQDGEGRSQPEWISPSALVALIERLEPGVSELACHPGEESDEAIASTMYRQERAIELASLCDPLAREAVERRGVLLRSFRDMGFVVVA